MTKTRKGGKTMKRLLVMLLSISMISGLFTFGLGNASADEVDTTADVGTTYYISSLNGDNNADGTSPGTAWESVMKINDITLQPGDKVLLERGSVFNYQYLHIKGSGSAENPIIIGTYGDEDAAKPVIDAKGQGIWYQDYGITLDNAQHVNKGYVSSTILLYDVEYIEISGLEIVNNVSFENEDYSLRNKMNRTGVAVVAQNAGTIDHIVLSDLYIHDVKGNVYDKHMNNGGIYFTVFKPANEAETGIAKYDDVLIENCRVENVSRWGIALAYTAYHAQFNAAEIPDDICQKYGATNVIIRNNYIKDVGGDSITTMYCFRPVVEYNVSDGAAKEINEEIYNATSFGRVAAAVWPWKCKDAVFQYNEVFDTHYNGDGQAWDADWGDGVIYQYNYSHNNEGGCVMICGVQAVNTIFRYNISYKDLIGALDLPGNPRADFYNNVFYMAEGVPFIRERSSGGVAVLTNNIIYNAGETKTEDWSNNCTVTYDHNLYYNYNEIPADDENAVTGDPMFVNAESAPTSTTGVVHDRTAFDGFKLQDGSPAINAGVYVSGSTGYDFFGNKVGLVPDIGVYESSVEDTMVEGVFSNVYEVTDTWINGIAKGTTVETLLSNLIYDERTTVKVYNEDGTEVTEGVLTDTMVLKATYNDSVKEYKLGIEKVYTEYSPEGMTATVGSYQPNNTTEGGGDLALDNNLSTMWHTNWNGCAEDERWIAIDMGTKQDVAMLKYVPRSTGGTNGIITEYEIYVSDTGEDGSWTKVETRSNTWAGDSTVKYAEFDTVNTRFVKLVATESLSQNAGRIFASAAEIRLGYEVE